MLLCPYLSHSFSLFLFLSSHAPAPNTPGVQSIEIGLALARHVLSLPLESCLQPLLL
jgi:hypothetical protein